MGKDFKMRMGYSKLDKINTLVALDFNKGNKLRTAREMGVDRKTVTTWEKQLASDLKLLKQVEAALGSIANIEELIAIKAQAEISRRLDESADQIKMHDLLKIKDSGISNSRLIRGEPTENVSQVLTPTEVAASYISHLRSKGYDEETVRAIIAEPLRLPSGDTIEVEFLSEAADRFEDNHTA